MVIHDRLKRLIRKQEENDDQKSSGFNNETVNLGRGKAVERPSVSMSPHEIPVKKTEVKFKNKGEGFIEREKQKAERAKVDRDIETSKEEIRRVKEERRKLQAERLKRIFGTGSKGRVRAPRYRKPRKYSRYAPRVLHHQTNADLLFGDNLSRTVRRYGPAGDLSLNGFLGGGSSPLVSATRIVDADTLRRHKEANQLLGLSTFIQNRKQLRSAKNDPLMNMLGFGSSKKNHFLGI